MRSMKEDLTAQEIIDGFRAYYNFIRPHQALEGKTEEAGIDLELGENRWMDLIRKATNRPVSNRRFTSLNNP